MQGVRKQERKIKFDILRMGDLPSAEKKRMSKRNLPLPLSFLGGTVSHGKQFVSTTKQTNDASEYLASREAMRPMWFWMVLEMGLGGAALSTSIQRITLTLLSHGLDLVVVHSVLYLLPHPPTHNNHLFPFSSFVLSVAYLSLSPVELFFSEGYNLGVCVCVFGHRL